MNDLLQVLKKGTLLIIEMGAYSDKSWVGPVRLLVRATKHELAEAYKAEWKPAEEDDKPDPSGFLPWLIASGRAVAVDVEAWHVGSYGEFEP